MKPKTNRIFILLASVPMIVGTLMYLNLKFNSPCNGLVEALGTVVAIIGLCLIAGVTIIAQMVLMSKKPELKYRTTTIALILICGIIIVWSSNKSHEYFKSEVIFEAEFYHPEEGNLKLRANGTYSAKGSFTDWSCTYDGKYSESGNLIILTAELVVQTDSLFSEKYLLMEPFLIPEHEYQTATDSSHWLRIVKNKR